MSILIVEDDQQIVSYLKKGLEEESFEVEIATNGEDGLALIRQKSYSVIILDWMLPKLSGIDLCTIVRNNNINTPILILSAKGDIQDKIEGLNSGADDYLSKPFSFDELVARINALTRRKKLQKDTIYKCGDVEFNVSKRVLRRNENEIILTTKEYELLDFLMQNQGHVVSMKKIITHLWGEEEISSNIVNVLIHHLRVKLCEDNSNKYIKTIRKLGFKIDND